jgi:RimJ/RimL family protein N-acetyltransferase
MYFEKIKSDRIFLSPMDVNDANQYAQWLNDAEIMQNLQGIHWVLTLDAERQAIDKLSKEHNYAIVLKNDGNLIGNIGLMDCDYLNRSAELGIFIGRKDLWNKGYGTEAIKALCEYGFLSLNLENIMLKVYNFNTRAIKAYQKSGFKIIGTRRQALHRRRQSFDIIYMDLIPADLGL